MNTKERTTVVLSPKAQKIKDKFSHIYGLKNILSAGLILFDRLSSDKQIELINELSSPSGIVQKQPQTIREVLKNLIEKTKKSQEKSLENHPGERIIVQPSDEKLWNELKKIVEDSEKSKKQKSG